MSGAAPRLGLALSGGGDSTALLLALREAAPGIALTAYIVDHRLRPESTREAELTARRADAAGAKARLLTWKTPRPGQNLARKARHRLLAEACAADGVDLLCLAHTLDDRIETLRMRAARTGPEHRMAGPGALDPSPCWPEGRGLTIARPVLDLTRAQLRRYLALRGADFIEDPSNTDTRYERVRLRNAPLADAGAAALLARSDAARRALDADRAHASAIIERGAALTDWGGARLQPEAFEGPGAARALETLLLAVSGQETVPAPQLTAAGLAALAEGRAWTGAGAMLTADGWLGRDPGAAGRADAAGRAKNTRLALKQGEAGVFDGRFEITGPAEVELAGKSGPGDGTAGAVPAPFRATLPIDRRTGAALAGGATERARLIAPERISARLMARRAPAWFDAVCAEARACAALAKPGARSNIGS